MAPATFHCRVADSTTVISAGLISKVMMVGTAVGGIPEGDVVSPSDGGDSVV